MLMSFSGTVPRLDSCCRVYCFSFFRTQSEVVAPSTSLVAITVLHRSCTVAAEPLHRVKTASP